MKIGTIYLTKVVPKILVILLLSLGWLTDVYMYSAPSITIYCIACLVFFLLIIMFCKKGYLYKNIHLILIIMFGYISYGITTLETGSSLIDIFVYFLTFLFAILCLRWNSEWIDIGYKFMVVVGSIYAIATIYLKFDVKTYLHFIAPAFNEYYSFLVTCYNQGYVAGLTAHYSRNGIYMALLCIFIFSYILYNKNKSLYIVGLVISIGALILTGKRAHTLFTLITMLVLLYLFMSNRPRKRVINFIFIIVVGLVVLVYAVNYIPFVNNLYLRFSNLADDKNVNTRFELWKLAWAYFRENPIFGMGWRHFMQTTVSRFATNLNVHNMYIQLLCETGIIGFIFFVYFFATILYKSITIFLKGRKKVIELSEDICKFLLISIGIQIFFLLYCFTGSPFDDIHVYITYMFAVSITFYYEYREKNNML